MPPKKIQETQNRDSKKVDEYEKAMADIAKANFEDKKQRSPIIVKIKEVANFGDDYEDKPIFDIKVK